MRRAAGWLAVFLWSVCIAGSAIALGVRAAGYSEDGMTIAPLFGLAAFATVGLIVALRRPKVPLGWVFSTIGALAGLLAMSTAYLAWAVTVRPRLSAPLDVGALWVGTWSWYPLIGTTLTLTVLLFPEGLPSRRWRPVFWLDVGLLATVTAITALQPTLSYGDVRAANPIGIRAWHTDDVSTTPVFAVFSVALALVVVAGVVSLIMRFHRAKGVERQQISWFAFAAGVGGLVIIASILWPSFGDSGAGTVAFAIFLAAIPISCGLAIFRYRLYDIDRIVSRTVSYVLITGLLAGVYVGCVTLLSDVLPFRGDVGTAASVLVAVALFAPLRRRVQGLVDRRLNRARYDAATTAAAFATRLRDQVDLDVVRADLLGVVAGTVEPAHASLWLRQTS